MLDNLYHILLSFAAGFPFTQVLTPPIIVLQQCFFRYGFNAIGAQKLVDNGIVIEQVSALVIIQQGGVQLLEVMISYS